MMRHTYLIRRSAGGIPFSAVLLALAAVSFHSNGAVAHPDHAHGSTTRPAEAEPAWLTRTAELHGAPGPWATLGAIAGRDAVARLDNPKGWEVRVVCWVPDGRPMMPHACMADGLQVTTGASLGKQNIVIARSPDAAELPTIFVIRPDAQGGGEGFAYALKPAIAEEANATDFSDFGALSSDLATRPVGSLFDVRRLSEREVVQGLQAATPNEDNEES